MTAIAAGAVLIIVHQHRELLRSARERLAAVVQVEAEHVASWRAERLADGAIIGGNSLVARTVQLAQRPGAERERAALSRWCASLLQQPDTTAAQVLDPGGRVLASAGDPFADHLDPSSWPATLALSDPERDGAGALHLDLLVPLAVDDGGQRRLVGLAVLRLDPEVQLVPFVHAWPLVRGRGSVALIAGTVQFRTGGPSDHSPGPAETGRDVLAADRIVPGSSWTVRSALEVRDALAPLRDLLPWIGALAATLMAGVVTAAARERREQLRSFDAQLREAAIEREARIRAENAFRESEATFQAAFLETRVGIAIVDGEGRFMAWNPALGNMLGLEHGQLVAVSFSDLLHPEDRSASVEAFAKLVRGEREHSDMLRRYVRGDGKVLHARYGVTAIRDPRGGFRFAVAIVEDVTERVLAEEELRSSRDSLRYALEASNDGIWDWDIERNEVRLSPRVRELLGKDLETIHGVTDAFELLHPDERPQHQENIEALLSGAAPSVAFEHRARGPTGDWRWVFDRARVVVRSPDGRPCRIVGAVTDITERKELQLRLQVADRMATIGTLAAGVAHEINNPMSYVVSNLGYAQEMLTMLASSVGGPIHPAWTVDDQAAGFTALRAALDDAWHGADRIRAIVRDLRTLSRTDDALHAVDVRQVLDAALSVARPAIARRARLSIRAAPVPAVLADEGRLGQVFLNLLVNAAQAIPEGRADDNEIGIAMATAADGRVAVDIWDSGCGIPRENVDRIFEPFFTTKPAGIGTGLGLAICQRIVASIEGTITVESTQGKGTTFRVLLVPAG
ncbi:MAG TPA: PAS domain S-box protein [Anaeromyxobacteraceae bacterium]|nr:PAS domain S-box protein [Anaeromyxobacteraceae bacterium]